MRYLGQRGPQNQEIWHSKRLRLWSVDSLGFFLHYLNVFVRARSRGAPAVKKEPAMAISKDERRFDLVCEGGGVKGIGLVGALSVLEERGYQAQNIAGNSAGAIVSTLYGAGYSAPELRQVIEAQNFASFMDPGPEDRLPLAGKPLSVLMDLGIYEGQVFQARMEELLLARGIRTFKDLVHPAFANDRRFRYKVQVIASDLTTRRMLILPQDAEHLGIVPDDLNVALAVRMSMSFPLFFEPVRVRNLKTGLEHIIVDGGVLSNYPIWLFDSGTEPEWPTFGLRLVEPDPRSSIGDRLPPPPPRRDRGVSAVVGFLTSLISTMLEGHDRYYIERSDFARTIPISTLGVSTLDFSLTKERQAALYEAGRQAAGTFLDNWDFEGYVEAFRKRQPKPRREEIAELMREATARAHDAQLAAARRSDRQR
jgi:NTE family protein